MPTLPPESDDLGDEVLRAWARSSPEPYAFGAAVCFALSLVPVWFGHSIATSGTFYLR